MVFEVNEINDAVKALFDGWEPGLGNLIPAPTGFGKPVVRVVIKGSNWSGAALFGLITSGNKNSQPSHTMNLLRIFRPNYPEPMVNINGGLKAIGYALLDMMGL